MAERIVVAPNAFKGFLSPVAAADAIATGLRRSHPGAALDLAPLSDGGDGFLETMLVALGGGERRAAMVRGPVHAPVAAAFGLVGGAAGDGAGARDAAGSGSTAPGRAAPLTAIVEMARAAGLALLPRDQLEPLAASTGGVGELLREARQAGATRFLIGLGGSATSDGGTGMARALGYRFLDADGRELPEGGGPLRRLARIDASGFDPSWLLQTVIGITDVANPLLGAEGTARVFGRQKGASATQIELLEEGLGRLAEVAARDLALDRARGPEPGHARAAAAEMPGAGAAGGLGFGLQAFLGATLEPGARAVADAVRLRVRLQGAALLVTGEGRLDAQSGMGKAPAEAGRLARAAGVRAVALAGSLGEGWKALLGEAFDEVRAVDPAGVRPPRSSAEAAARLAEAAARL
jgi:glycerate kinase